MVNQEMDFEPFLYPTKDERIEIQKSQPLLSKLYLLSKGEDKIVNSPVDFIKENDFIIWKNRFNNKVRRIEFSYILLRFYYLRGIPDANWAETTANGAIKFFPSLEGKALKTNKFLFDYSTENFFYHYVSAADIVYHLLNTHYKLAIKSGTRLNQMVTEKLKSFPIGKTLTNFEAEIRSFRKDRNDLAHNFSFNEIDMRSKVEFIDGVEVTTMGSYSYITSTEILNKIENSISIFSEMMDSLNKEIG